MSAPCDARKAAACLLVLLFSSELPSSGQSLSARTSLCEDVTQCRFATTRTLRKLCTSPTLPHINHCRRPAASLLQSHEDLIAKLSNRCRPSVSRHRRERMSPQAVVLEPRGARRMSHCKPRRHDDFPFEFCSVKQASPMNRGIGQCMTTCIATALKTDQTCCYTR